MFNCDPDKHLEPDEPKAERDPDEWVFRGGQWIYVGDIDA